MMPPRGSNVYTSLSTDKHERRGYPLIIDPVIDAKIDLVTRPSRAVSMIVASRWRSPQKLRLQLLARRLTTRTALGSADMT